MLPFSGHPNRMSAEKLDEVHQAALGLAQKVGLLVANKDLRERLDGQEDVRIEGQRVYFHPDRIERALTAMRFPATPDPHRFTIICGAYVIQTRDLETHQVRETTLKDLVDLTLLGEQLGMAGSPAVRPNDLPLELQEIAMYKTTWEYSAQRPEPLFDTTPMSTVQAAETIYEMAQAISKPFSVGMYIISPFTCPPDGMEIIAAFLDRQVPMWIGTMPIAGLTAPIFLFGAHIQALAELMAGIALLYSLRQGDAPIFWTPIDSVRAHPFDMRHSVFVTGSPEDQAGTILQAQINRRYGCPLVAKSLLTTAREPDQQATAEKCSHTLLAALFGFRIFTNAGFLSQDDYLSPIQVVIDHEIVEYVRRVIHGVPCHEQAMALETIRELAPVRGSFIEHPTTLGHFRSATWDPSLFSHLPLETSASARSTPSLLDRARRKAQQLIQAGDYVLPESKRNILRSIYSRAEQKVH